MVDLSPEECVLLLDIINAVSVPGRLAEQVVELKRKLAVTNPPVPSSST